ncbi:MAG: hypothetical protein KDA20_02610 [Phycisphaerales bacterium]|nr:hypothetical protein [Phycisphaerales bacterium]
MVTRTRLNLTLPIAACFAALTAIAAAAPLDAQRDEIAPAQTPSATAEAPNDPTTQQMIGRLFARQTRDRLRAIFDPTTDDYRLTARCLRLAQRAVGEDIELLRQEIEAWSAAGAAKEALAGTRELIRRDPADTVAQLRYITSQLDKLQTVDDRLAAAQRFLGPDGRKLDPTVRSRIALDAALLAREAGEEELFRELLQTAATLDVTNKQAATLFATYYLDRLDDPHDRVDLLINVVLADPLDISALENLARELVRLGAFAGAMRFYDRMRDILQTSNDDLGAEQLTEYLICKWNTVGHAAMLDIIADLDRTRLTPYLRNRQLQRRDDIDPGPFLEPIHPLELEEVRLCALVGLGARAEGAAFIKRPEEADEIFQRPSDAPTTPKATLVALDRCIRSIDVARTGIENPKFREEIRRAGRDPNELYAEVSLHGLWIRLLVGCRLDEAEQQLGDLERGLLGVNLQDQALDRYRGWLAGLRGDADTARAKLEPLAPTDDQALWGLAVTEERAGFPLIAAERFAELANRRPYSALGTAARARAGDLYGHPIPRAQLAEELDATALRVAPWFERMTAEPRTFMELELSVAPSIASPLDFPELIVSLRNTSPVPLGIGSNAPISSRVLLTPRLMIDTTEVPNGLRAMLIAMKMKGGARLDQAEAQTADDLRQLGARLLEVVDFDRRLRLERNERVSAKLSACLGTAGRLIADDVAKRSTIAWRATQGFMPGADGFAAGPLCLTTQSENLIITSLGSELTHEDALAILQQDQLSVQDILITSSKLKRIAIEQALDAATQANQFEALLQGVEQALPKLDRLQRTLFMLRLGDLSIPQMRNQIDFVERVIDTMREQPTSIGLAYACFRASSPDDRALIDALASDDPDVAAIAKIRLAQIASQAEGKAIDTPETPVIR